MVGEGSSSAEPTAYELKEEGNVCVRNSQYSEALLLYSQAIKLSPKDPALYSNRSLTFLKLKQYYYANQDAETVIQLDPSWAKGYFRKAEILASVGHYDSALLSYGRAMQLQPGDRSLLAAAQKAATYSGQQADYEKRLPWVGAGAGIILGVAISICDNLFTKTPSLTNPTLMVLLVIVFAGLGYIVAGCIRYYTRLNKKNLLEPPLDILEEFNQTQTDSQNDVEADNNTFNKTKYTKAQARMRFRKGKS